MIIYAYTYIYIYIYTHIRTLIYVCIYIYIYTERERERKMYSFMIRQAAAGQLKAVVEQRARLVSLTSFPFLVNNSINNVGNSIV